MGSAQKNLVGLHDYTRLSKTLTEFFQACATAQSFKENGSNTFAPLEIQTTQEGIFDRRSEELGKNGINIV